MSQFGQYENLHVERTDNIFVFTLQKPPENRITSQFCREIIRAFDETRRELGPESEGAVIVRGNDAKFFCTVR